MGGIPEVVDDGRTGYLVPLDDEVEAGLAKRLTELLEDPDRAAELGRAGRARAVESFGWDAIAARTMEVYASVLR